MDRTRYRVVSIPKRSGGIRVLEIPDDRLMAEQRKILAWLYGLRLAASPHAHGFVRGRSIASNARPHVGKRVVVKLDIADFFPSTTAEMVRQALQENRVALDAAEAIVRTCTLDGRLPQGAPTSPFLANLVAIRLDIRLAGLARTWRDGAYTRYADDLVFSGSVSRMGHIIPAATRIVEDAGYRINDRKTRIYRSGGRQIVAGVVLNTRPSVPREVRRNLRAAIHHAREALIRGAAPPEPIQRLRGLAAHVYSINREAGASFIRDVDEIARLIRAVESVGRLSPPTVRSSS